MHRIFSTVAGGSQAYTPKNGTSIQDVGKHMLSSRVIWLWLSKPMVPFWLVDEFTHFRTYFGGWIESDVHWGITDLGFDPCPFESPGTSRTITACRPDLSDTSPSYSAGLTKKQLLLQVPFSSLDFQWEVRGGKQQVWTPFGHQDLEVSLPAGPSYSRFII